MHKLSQNFFARTSLFVLAVVLVGLVSPSVVDAATPSVTGTPTTNTTSVPRYSKFELTFNINKTFADARLPYYYYDSDDTPANNTIPNRTSPYGQDGITINTVFISPTNKTLTVPSFYYQDYTRSRSGSYEVMNVNGSPVWKTRFAPEETGTYRYYITIEDKEGVTRYPTSGELTFNAVTSSSKGFIRPSLRDVRFFDYQNGTSFIPIAGQAQWWGCCTLKSYEYEDKFAQYKQGGINLVRIWDQNDGYALSLEGTADHKFTDAEAIAAPKGTVIDQADAYREDKIIESAETNGVAIELSSHGDVYWNWDASIYNEGWNPNPVAMDNKFHINYWKRNFRYRVARFGYSTSILTWETWNEHGHIASNSAEWRFYQTFSAYQRATDPYDHAITTSQGSQTFSPGFWSSTSNDVANYHDYLMSSRYPQLYNDEVAFVYLFSQCLRYTNGSTCNLGLGDGSTWSGAAKPWIWGEIGILTAWDVPDPAAYTGERGIRSRVNEIWAGLFSPLGTVPIEWNPADSATLTTTYARAKIASDFFSTVDYNVQKFDHLPTTDVSISSYSGDKLTSSNASNVRALGLRSLDKKTILLWAQNKAYNWGNSTTPTSASANITVPNVPSGTYRVEYWNTETGQVTNGSNITANGSLVVPVSNLQKSVAIKVISTSITTTSPACDANQDNIDLVDLSDYSILVSNFFKTSNFGKSDINKDNLVDIADYGLLAASFLQTCVP